MNTHRTIRYRLHPCTQAKARNLHELAGACGFVWNHFAGIRKDEYAAFGKHAPNFCPLGSRFTDLRKQMSWLQGHPSGIVKDSLKPVETCQVTVSLANKPDHGYQY